MDVEIEYTCRAIFVRHFYGRMDVRIRTYELRSRGSPEPNYESHLEHLERLRVSYGTFTSPIGGI